MSGGCVLRHRAEEIASQVQLNRSQLYARALETFLDGQGEDPVTDHHAAAARIVDLVGPRR